jgi:hypothetical protein
MLLRDKSEKIYCGFILLSICKGSKKGRVKAFLVISHIVCDGEWMNFSSDSKQKLESLKRLCKGPMSNRFILEKSNSWSHCHDPVKATYKPLYTQFI